MRNGRRTPNRNTKQQVFGRTPQPPLPSEKRETRSRTPKDHRPATPQGGRREEAQCKAVGAASTIVYWRNKRCTTNQTGRGVTSRCHVQENERGERLGGGGIYDRSERLRPEGVTGGIRAHRGDARSAAAGDRAIVPLRAAYRRGSDKHRGDKEKNSDEKSLVPKNAVPSGGREGERGGGGAGKGGKMHDLKIFGKKYCERSYHKAPKARRMLIGATGNLQRCGCWVFFWNNGYKIKQKERKHPNQGTRKPRLREGGNLRTRYRTKPNAEAEGGVLA